MARPMKQGLDYYPTDIDILQNKKIRILKARYGAEGFALYHCLLMEIYRNGYYINYDEDFVDLMSSEFMTGYDRTAEIIEFMCAKGLFDNELFTKQKILTSKGVQRRYQEVVKNRVNIKINPDYWLLPIDETRKNLLNNDDENKNEINYDKNEINHSKNEINSTKKSKVKESKENKNKANESKAVCVVPSLDGDFEVHQELYDELTHTYENTDIDKSLKALILYLSANPDKLRTSSATEGYIRMWINTDAINGRNQCQKYTACYDIEEYESTSALDEEW